MKLRLAAVLLLLAGGVVLWLTTTRRSKPERQPAPEGVTAPQPIRTSALPAVAPEGNPEVPEETAAASTEPALPGPVTAPPKPISLAAAEELPSGPAPEPTTEGASPPLPPATALENVRTAFRQYCLRLGGNPVGSNPEITAALKGENPQQVVFITPEDGARINQGQLVDNWDTPYFFHQLSRTEMEIRSAGPDRRMWTSDDLVLK